MILTPRFGLEHGIHSKDGVVSDKSRFIDNVVETCKRNDFLTVRGFSTSEYFDPRLVIIGTQYDKHTGKPAYYLPKLKAILSALVKPKSILVGEFQNCHPEIDMKEMFKDRAFYDFIGINDVRFVDDNSSLDRIEELRAAGIYGSPSFSAHRRQNFLAPGILQATQDVDIDARVLAVMNFNHFIADYYILKFLENNNVSYLLICPKIALLPQGVHVPYDQETAQEMYEKQLVSAAKINLNNVDIEQLK